MGFYRVKKPLPEPHLLDIEREKEGGGGRGGKNEGSIYILEGEEEVARHLVAKPAAGHARRDFEQIRHNAFVKSAEPFLGDDDGDGVPDRFVLVAHAGHGVDLEAAAENVAGSGERAVSGCWCWDKRVAGCAHNGYVHVWATAPEMAPAASFRRTGGFFSPSGVSHLRTDSYVMKFRPTFAKRSMSISISICPDLT